MNEAQSLWIKKNLPNEAYMRLDATRECCLEKYLNVENCIWNAVCSLDLIRERERDEEDQAIVRKDQRELTAYLKKIKKWGYPMPNDCGI